MIDPEKLLAMPPIVTRQVLTPRDTALYALGIGAEELDFVYEERLRALPTMAVVLGYPGFIWRDPALGVDWKRILHGEQSVQLHRELPVVGEIIGETRIAALFDKGADKGAIALVTREIRDAAGTHLATLSATTFLRGDGGFGGTPDGAPVPHAVPTDRAPDHEVTLTTAANQALVYRLSGDHNPLHIDPAVAQAAGFARPILHGLCSYGVAGRALLAALCDQDPARLTRIDARFSAPVYPGETLRTRIWREGAGRAGFVCHVVERDLMVLNHGYVEFS